MQIYIKLIVGRQLVSECWSRIGDFWTYQPGGAAGMGSSFSLFLSYLGWGWVVLIVGTFESLISPSLYWVQGWFLAGSMKQVYVWYWD